MSDMAMFRQLRSICAGYRRHWRSGEHRCRITGVETLDANQRRVALLAAVVVALVVCVLVGTALLTRPKTQFEREQSRAEASNPHWLKVEIATSDDRHEYRENEAIPVVVHFSSAVRYMYRADAADGASKAAATDELHISNGEEMLRNMTGIVCCDSRLIGLDDEPFTPPSWTPLKLAPGDYEIYLTSRRVFNWDTKGIDVFQPSSFDVGSNMLEIRVVPNSGSSDRH
jgi:hypothetical protein